MRFPRGDGRHGREIEIRAFNAPTFNVYAWIMKPPAPNRKSLRTDARALIETCAGWNSRLAARRISLFFDRELAELGLTVAQLGLMALIAVMRDDTLGSLANRAGLEQSTLSRNLRTLE